MQDLGPVAICARPSLVDLGGWSRGSIQGDSRDEWDYGSEGNRLVAIHQLIKTYFHMLTNDEAMLTCSHAHICRRIIVNGCVMPRQDFSKEENIFTAVESNGKGW